jgi:anhydro-N-acetylmuramic acid kinase
LPANGDLQFYIGLMSGTSLDGIDGVLVRMDPSPPSAGSALKLQVQHHAFAPFDELFRQELMALNTPGGNELHRAALAGNRLARLYAQVCIRLLEAAGLPAGQVVAIGAHGQTVRHRPLEFDADTAQGHPAVGYTLQLNNPALLAELTGIDVVADFRTRDLAAGGQGAPLVPAFHQEIFGAEGKTVAVLNIGGISNLSVIPAHGDVTGWDCGPGNALMDFWCQQHTGQTFDRDGQWAASGQVIPALLCALLAEPYLHAQPPKSTGRDLFNPTWLAQQMVHHSAAAAADVQTTLCEFTAQACAHDVCRSAPELDELIVCGGGALNLFLMQRLAENLPVVRVTSSQTHGLAPLQVEAAAFAWLAYKAVHRETASLKSVTGAQGARVLGAIYPR